MQKGYLACDHDGKTRRSASPWRTWRRQIQTTPRRTKIALVAVVVCCATAGFFRGMRDIHDQWVKQYPTNFSTLFAKDNSLPGPEQPFRQIHGPSIDDRYLYTKALGKGQEGTTAIYVDVEVGDEVVLKTFENKARNDLPPQLSHHYDGVTRSWPTEIEAGLMFAAGSTDESSFVPVRDYFILRDEDSWSWALVTPFVKDGTLSGLAKKERRDGIKSTDELDAEYRPSLLQMLHGLQPLHDAGLCHDDIKLDNIFLETRSQWLLGDLGNVREVDHAWHKTASWTRQNQWRDCQKNDVRRAIKSYLGFLRASLQESESFDREFWARERSWSRLYWDFVENPTSLRHLLNVQTNMNADGRPAPSSVSSSSSASRSSSELSRVTERELLCTTIPSRLWKRWWWLPGS